MKTLHAKGALLASLLLSHVLQSHSDEDKKKSFIRSNKMPPNGKEEFEYAVYRENGDYGCPYVVEDEEAAWARARDDSVEGTVVELKDLRFCRTGNHFSTAFRHLAIGYCCKSKLVALPPKDDVVAPGLFNEGTPGPRWFDFTSAPDVDGFNRSVCENIYWGGKSAFHMEKGLDPSLMTCVKEVPRLVGCEAAYYFPRDMDVCPPKEPATDSGNLVIHVRSGDIFNGEETLSYYGQPPLLFYLTVMAHRQWDRIDLVTSYDTPEGANPVVADLQGRLDRGLLPPNTHIHTDRSMEEDLRAMMCADALATARSTIVCLTTFHTTAKRIYGPVDCNRQLAELASSRPDIKVYGLDWDGHYSVYRNWENTERQTKEMLEYSKIRGLRRCPPH